MAALLVPTSEAIARDEVPVPSRGDSVLASQWGSYVVVMEDDPLVATFAVDELGARHPDPRGQLAVPGPGDGTGRAVPGDRGNVDVEPAHRRHARGDRSRAPELVRRRGQVGHDDHGEHGRSRQRPKSQATPFEMGAGQVDPGGPSQSGSMFQPGLVYDAGFNDYLGFLCDDAPEVFANAAATCASLANAGIPTEAENLNYPSIGAVPGQVTVTRTVTSVAPGGGVAQRCRRPLRAHAGGGRQPLSG